MKRPSNEALLAAVTGHRAGMQHRKPPVAPEPVGAGEESVWGFPRPPKVQRVSERLHVEFAGRVVADTTRGLRIVETAGAPVYFFPPDDVAADVLDPLESKWTVCEWKGVATYFDLVVGDRRSREAAFTYPDPFDDLGREYRRLAGWLAFYASRVDGAFIGNERVKPQPGGFYAGWVTAKLRGPIKGVAGSEGW